MTTSPRRRRAYVCEVCAKDPKVTLLPRRFLLQGDAGSAPYCDAGHRMTLQPNVPYQAGRHG